MEHGYHTNTEDEEQQEFYCHACRKFVVSRDKLVFEHKFAFPLPNEKAYIFNDFPNIQPKRIEKTYYIDRLGPVRGHKAHCRNCSEDLGWQIVSWTDHCQSTTPIGPNNETLSIGQIILKSWKLK